MKRLTGGAHGGKGQPERCEIAIFHDTDVDGNLEGEIYSHSAKESTQKITKHL